MKKNYLFLLVLAVLLSAFSVNATQLTINVATAGGLEDALYDQEEVDFDLIENLTVTGSLNDVDIAFLNSMSKDYALRSLNLSDVSVVNNALATAAFKETKLSHITLPKSLVSMGKECFHSSELKSISIPTTNLKSISETCFTWSTQLEELEIPEGVETLEKQCLCFCVSLRKLTLPSTITTIGETAILGAYSWAFTGENDIPLIELNIKATTVPAVGFGGVALSPTYNPMCELYVPVGSKSAYAANKLDPGDEWYGFGMIANIYEKDFAASVKEGKSNVSTIKVHASNGFITIDGVENEANIEIYNMNGSLLKTSKVNSYNNTIEFTQTKGLYVLRAGNEIVKFSIF